MEHFAIISAMRGGGLGGEAIRNFVAADPMPVILEVEPSGSNDMADRRIAFYERCGFTGHRDFEYIQPPYSPGLPEVPLMPTATNMAEATIRVMRVMPETGLVPTMAIALAATVVNRNAMTVTTIQATTACHIL